MASLPKFAPGGSHADRMHELSKSALEKEQKKASDRSSLNLTAMIDAGRGHEKYAETKTKAEAGDPLAKEYILNHNEEKALQDHKEERQRLGEGYVRDRGRKAQLKFI